MRETPQGEQPEAYDPAGDPLAPVPLPARTAPAAVLDGDGIVVNLERVDPDNLPLRDEHAIHVLPEDGSWPAIGDRWDGTAFTAPPAPEPTPEPTGAAADPAAGDDSETVAQLRELVATLQRRQDAFAALVIDHRPETIAAALEAGAISAAQADALTPSAERATTTPTS